jgi:hypothetical protein
MTVTNLLISVNIEAFAFRSMSSAVTIVQLPSAIAWTPAVSRTTTAAAAAAPAATPSTA